MLEIEPYHTGRDPLVELSDELQGAPYAVLRRAVLAMFTYEKPTALSRMKEVMMPVVQVNVRD